MLSNPIRRARQNKQGNRAEARKPAIVVQNAQDGSQETNPAPVQEASPARVDPFVVGISSRALFNLDESHRVFEEKGLDAYQKYQIEHENEPLEPGDAFPLVKKLLHLNTMLDESPVQVILLSRNSADTGLRVFKSIEHHGLDITRAAFCGGDSPYRYIPAFKSNLFLSADGADVRHALDLGVAAATILPSSKSTTENDLLKIAFDGDAVLFSDESEQIYQSKGLDAFDDNERENAKKPMSGGPFKDVLRALQQIQMASSSDKPPLRTCLVTARGFTPAYERVVHTLRAWKIRIDESVFLAGGKKGDFLRAYDADVFFDDQQGHCDSARTSVATGHVPHGVINQLGADPDN